MARMMRCYLDPSSCFVGTEFASGGSAEEPFDDGTITVGVRVVEVTTGVETGPDVTTVVDVTGPVNWPSIEALPLVFPERCDNFSFT
jgi:hypothetical protein